ncbi:MAG: hypothetical protein MPJ50_11570 [Pirellulales bacterium]|nr:hypothetical protein [Pirellulales bacterium]
MTKKRLTRPVTSREYKIMLQAKRFAGTKEQVLIAAERFRCVFADAINKHAMGHQSTQLSGERFGIRRKKKQAIVEFLDTEDRRLQRAGFVFRQRQPMHGGPCELTLKFRHADRFLASQARTGRKVKFEEDIKITRQSDFVSLYSLSGKSSVDSIYVSKTLEDVRASFNPIKKQLGSAITPTKGLSESTDYP